MASRSERLSGWGRYPVATCSVADASTVEDVRRTLAVSPQLIGRGLGRSYGDSSLNPDRTLRFTGMDRVLAFDADTGRTVCEAGLSLDALIDLFLPRGWFAPVTPGTKFVTVGGMIASDVHGKNHHRDGSFCDHVEWIELLLPERGLVRCSRDEHRDLFEATCGGMGLTGAIVRACFRLLRVPTASIRQRTARARDLDALLTLAEESLDWTYSVAWVDCLAKGRSLGRSVLFLGEHARVDELPAAHRSDPLARRARRRKSVPLDLPSFVLGPLSVRLFNELYYFRQKAGEAVVDLDPYFYPLDAVGDWNRIYGRRGFVQYQCVLPLENSRQGLISLLEAISGAGQGSFLAVLKRMGGQSSGMLSFPRPGYTLALDFPLAAGTLALLDRLDAITVAHGGRVYLAKDARICAERFAAGYPRLQEFRDTRRRWNLDQRFRSLQSERLGI
ncbi:MAG: FAD-binding oxidoreductase [Sphingomonas sp.]|nr:FAD-binding oxidoreductase [Sphingomonas sp.]